MAALSARSRDTDCTRETFHQADDYKGTDGPAPSTAGTQGDCTQLTPPGGRCNPLPSTFGESSRAEESRLKTWRTSPKDEHRGLHCDLWWGRRKVHRHKKWLLHTECFCLPINASRWLPVNLHLKQVDLPAKEKCTYNYKSEPLLKLNSHT